MSDVFFLILPEKERFSSQKVPRGNENGICIKYIITIFIMKIIISI